MTVRKPVYLGHRGGDGRTRRESGVVGGGHFTKGPGGPSRVLDLCLEGSGAGGCLQRALSREWCDQSYQKFKGGCRKDRSRSREKGLESFATVPRQQMLNRSDPG